MLLDNHVSKDNKGPREATPNTTTCVKCNVKCFHVQKQQVLLRHQLTTTKEQKVKSKCVMNLPLVKQDNMFQNIYI